MGLQTHLPPNYWGMIVGGNKDQEILHPNWIDMQGRRNKR